MTTALPPEETADESLAPYRWTREAFHRLGETGVLGEGARWELIEGYVYQKMSQGNAHIAAGRAIAAALRAIFGEGFDVSSQYPLPLDDGNEPEPDVLVLRGSWQDYDGRDPDPANDVLVLVEVSDSSLGRDRGPKVRLYAKHGVPEYWIVNLRDRILEVRRRPHADGYAETIVLREGEAVAIGGGNVAVADVLPKA